jgi:putative hydrolase of the HAD superfamily
MRHLFFDLDRTLWDFDKNSELALRQLFDELGLHEQITSFDQFHEDYKQTNSLLWKEYGLGNLTKEVLRNLRFEKTLNNFNVHDPVTIQQMSDGYVEVSPRQTSLFPGAIETLRKLQNDGYNMHIITNGFKEVQFVKLENSQLHHFFDVILCSEDVGVNKPDERIFHYALKSANAHPHQSVMIGDDYEIDVAGAHRVGMHGIHFDPAHQFPDEDRGRIRSLTELPEILPWILRTI